MSILWRSCRGCRLRAPSAVSRRNRCTFYISLFLIVLVLVLLIPGGEIAVYKYAQGEGKNIFLTIFSHQHIGDDSEALVREQRSLPGAKLLLLWTPHDDSPAWQVIDDPFPACPVNACELTMDKQKVAEADAVMFSTSGFSRPEDLPPDHPPWQVRERFFFGRGARRVYLFTLLVVRHLKSLLMTG